MGRAINKTVTIVELIKVFCFEFPTLLDTCHPFLAIGWFYGDINYIVVLLLTQRRIVGLHQITSIASTDITDTWEPLEEGLLP